MSFGGGSPSPPPPPPPVPTLADPAVLAAQRAQLAANAQAMGRGSTILTSGTGVSSSPSTQKSTLLGGG